MIHICQPSQEELECDEKAQELAKELGDSDKKLSEVLKHDSKCRMDCDGAASGSSGSRHSPQASVVGGQKSARPEYEENLTQICHKFILLSSVPAVVMIQNQMVGQYDSQGCWCPCSRPQKAFRVGRS